VVRALACRATDRRPRRPNGCRSQSRAVAVEDDEDYFRLHARTLVTDEHELTVYPEAKGDRGKRFDLDADPGELHNRWHDEEYAGLKERLCRGLAEGLVSQEGAVPSRRNVA